MVPGAGVSDTVGQSLGKAWVEGAYDQPSAPDPGPSIAGKQLKWQ